MRQPFVTQEERDLFISREARVWWVGLGLLVGAVILRIHL